MRIIHTSDWHLGKSLEGHSRLEEQQNFIEEFIDIVNKKDADMIIIAGDIYDNVNPPAKAEKLFYSAVKRISDNGKRLVLVIAGNHDNPERLCAANPLAHEQGIIIIGKPKTVVEAGEYGNCTVVDSGEGYLEIELNGEKAVIIALAYPSEKRLNEIFIKDEEDKENVKTYSEKIGEIFYNRSQKYREDTINLAVSHLFTLGGESTDSERSIELGGSLALDSRYLPKKAQYIALGHLHKPQKVKGTEISAYYSGSPLPYSKSEVGYSKSCKLIDVEANKKCNIDNIYFNNYKPIEIWKCSDIESAIEKCRENSNRESWVYLEIETDKFLSQEDIKSMRSLKKDIVEIIPRIKGEEKESFDFDNIKEKSMKEVFKDFYLKERGVEPDDEVVELFLDIVQEEEDNFET